MMLLNPYIASIARRVSAVDRFLVKTFATSVIEIIEVYVVSGLSTRSTISWSGASKYSIQVQVSRRCAIRILLLTFKRTYTGKRSRT